MKAIVLTDATTATKTASDLDAQYGYPCDGVDVGGGVHAPPALSRTLRYADVLKHPTDAKWAVQIDVKDVGDAKVAAVVATEKTAPPADLDATWDGATKVASADAAPADTKGAG